MTTGMRKHSHANLESEGFALFLAGMRLVFVELFQLFRLLRRWSASGFARHRGLGLEQLVLGIAGVEKSMLLWRMCGQRVIWLVV